jgi:lysyl-tRNA synthetase class II
LHGTEVCVAGRLASKRDSSSKLIFYDLVGNCGDTNATAPAALGEAHVVPQIQLIASRAAHSGPSPSSASPSASATDAAAAPHPSEAELHASFARLHHALKKGDLVWVRGVPSKSKVGQISLLVKEIQLLAPSWHEIPTKLTEPVSST